MFSEKYAVVVGIDFGTSASSFAYAYKIGSSKPEIVTHDKWPDQPGGGMFKTDTALLYDTQTWSIAAWGASAMVCKPEKKKRKNQKNNNDVVCGDGGSVIAPKKGELWGPNSTLLIGDSNNININSPKTISATMFKLHLADLKQEDKPHLPMNIDYRKYVDFYRNILIVLTVPATYSERSKAILRECVWRVGLIESINAKNLEFTTEPEAAAIDCIPLLKQYGLKSGTNFMIVDCGGGAVDLTMRQLNNEGKISEITERTTDYCGSTYVDKEFVKYLFKKFGLFNAIQKLKDSHYEQFQYLVKQFSDKVKIPFTNNGFKPIDLDLQDCFKSFFDPVIQRIVWLIENHLKSSKRKCGAMFLVGGFSESPYLLHQIRSYFHHSIPNIGVPKQPISSIVRGAVQYGLDMRTVTTRVLRYTYGVQVLDKWKKNVDPPNRRMPSGHVYVFHKMAQRGTSVEVNHSIGYVARPSNPNQTDMAFNIFSTPALSARFCDEPGMRSLGTLKIDLSDINLGAKRLVEFSLTFGAMEIKATAKNKKTGVIYQTNLQLEF
ncbi:10581_t:CDS:2 [Entrophospora sp. SA101]|nr:5557_t:CDS:2 [Entrophospora sp. SA101]CAJ0764584.1 10581_t:CDS:2 [Entrophospora sp. SA101]CAJ0927695.1 697_t:CDS:2 [Entrophospora sp. SA101]